MATSAKSIGFDNQTTAPSNPSVGKLKVYFRDGTMYYRDSSGVETAVGTGSGGGSGGVATSIRTEGLADHDLGLTDRRPFQEVVIEGGDVKQIHWSEGLLFVASPPWPNGVPDTPSELIDYPYQLLVTAYETTPLEYTLFAYTFPLTANNTDVPIDLLCRRATFTEGDSSWTVQSESAIYGVSSSIYFKSGYAEVGANYSLEDPTPLIGTAFTPPTPQIWNNFSATPDLARACRYQLIASTTEGAILFCSVQPVKADVKYTSETGIQGYRFDWDSGNARWNLNQLTTIADVLNYLGYSSFDEGVTIEECNYPMVGNYGWVLQEGTTIPSMNLRGSRHYRDENTFRLQYWTDIGRTTYSDEVTEYGVEVFYRVVRSTIELVADQIMDIGTGDYPDANTFTGMCLKTMQGSTFMVGTQSEVQYDPDGRELGRYSNFGMAHMPTKDINDDNAAFLFCSRDSNAWITSALFQPNDYRVFNLGSWDSLYSIKNNNVISYVGDNMVIQIPTDHPQRTELCASIAVGSYIQMSYAEGPTTYWSPAMAITDTNGIDTITVDSMGVLGDWPAATYTLTNLYRTRNKHTYSNWNSSTHQLGSLAELNAIIERLSDVQGGTDFTIEIAPSLSWAQEANDYSNLNFEWGTGNIKLFLSSPSDWYGVEKTFSSCDPFITFSTFGSVNATNLSFDSSGLRFKSLFASKCVFPGGLTLGSKTISLRLNNCKLQGAIGSSNVGFCDVQLTDCDIEATGSWLSFSNGNVYVDNCVIVADGPCTMNNATLRFPTGTDWATINAAKPPAGFSTMHPTRHFLLTKDDSDNWRKADGTIWTEE